MVAIQVINLDYVMQRIGDTAPSPVVRVYGSSSRSLRRYCVNIHGVFPYLYFRPEDIHENSFDDPVVVERFLLILYIYIYIALLTFYL
jgi:hypothetical protein